MTQSNQINKHENAYKCKCENKLHLIPFITTLPFNYVFLGTLNPVLLTPLNQGITNLRVERFHYNCDYIVLMTKIHAFFPFHGEYS